MPVTFEKSQVLKRGDLDIFLTNASGHPSNAHSIYYYISYVDPQPPQQEVIIGNKHRKPINPSVGEYYASLRIPNQARVGKYRIRWVFKEFASTPEQTVVQEWEVTEQGSTKIKIYGEAQLAMIEKFRVLLRDNNPDKNYSFRPPQHEGTINQYNKVFGYIWEDHELLEYLERALDFWNMMPPETEHLNTIPSLVTHKPAWRTAILWGAIIHASTALQFNWVADEFSYSIGGISLDIEKSSRYESLRTGAEMHWNQAKGQLL